MVSGNKLMTVFTPVATPAASRDAGNPARPRRQSFSWRQILPLSHVTCQLRPMDSVCRGERLTKRDSMMDIAADLLFSDHGAPEYTAGRAGSILNS